MSKVKIGQSEPAWNYFLKNQNWQNFWGGKTNPNHPSTSHTSPMAELPLLFLREFPHCRGAELALAYLVIIILGGASVVKSKIQTAGSWNVDSFLKFIVIPDGMDCLHSLPSSPGSRDLQTSQESWLFLLFQHPEIKSEKLGLKYSTQVSIIQTLRYKVLKITSQYWSVTQGTDSWF